MKDNLTIPEIPILKIGRHPDNDIVLEPKDISKFHAKLYVCSPTSFIIEDTQSKNGTFFQGFRIERKLIDIKDNIQIGSNNFIIKDLYTGFIKDQTLSKKNHALDFSEEFLNLKGLPESLQELKKMSQDKQKQLRIGSLFASSIFGVGAILAAPVSGGASIIPALMGFHTTFQVLSSLGLGMLIPAISSDFISNKEKIDLLEKELKDNYKCPNPDCQDSFGNKEWDLLAKQKSCKKCKAIWVK